MITDYTFVEWPQAQMPAAANFVVSRNFWLFLTLVALLAVAYVLISRERENAKGRQLFKRMPELKA